MTQLASTKRDPFWRTLNRPIVSLLALQLMGGMLLPPSTIFFPLYVKDLGYSTMLIASLTTAKQIAGLLSSLVGGTLSDSLGRKTTLLLGNISRLVAMFAFLLVSPSWIALVWTIGGLGQGLHTLGGQSYMMDAAAPSSLGLISALYNWGYTLGGALSSPIVGLLLERWDYRRFAWVLIAFSACTVVANQFFLPRSPAKGSARSRRQARFFGYGDIATRPIVWILSALRFLPTVYYGAANLLIPLLLDAAGADKKTIAWYATVSWTTASLAQAVVGRAADRWGPKVATTLTFAVLIASIFGIGVWPTRLWTVLVFGTTGIAAAWSLSTLLPTLVAQAAVPEERGRILGFVHLWWSLAVIVGAMMGGALFEIAPGLPFLISGTANLASLVLLYVFFRLVRAGRLAVGDSHRGT